jgi:hypothetical protein
VTRSTGLLHTVDRILGAPLAELLNGRGVKRLTVVPHNMLHVIPYWALPSLAAYEVMVAPSAAQLVARRSARIEPRAPVAGNPTLDLDLASAEAIHVSSILASAGCDVTVLRREEVTERALSDHIPQCSLLHFSGHGRSDLSMPTRSALEVHPTVDTLTPEGDDLLTHLAATAVWQDVHRLAGSEWIDIHNESRADLPGHGRLERRIRPSIRRLELRLDYASRGTLLGQYALPEDDVSAAVILTQVAD